MLPRILEPELMDTDEDAHQYDSMDHTAVNVQFVTDLLDALVDWVFHRVIDGFMAQTGDPTGTGRGGSDLPDLPAEFSAEPFERGVVGMARSQNPNSANSQFFITFAPARFLDGQYTVWGRVVDGMEYVDMIKKAPRSDQSGTVRDPDQMISLKVEADKK
jgi:peptidylprolyl isomerase